MRRGRAGVERGPRGASHQRAPRAARASALAVLGCAVGCFSDRGLAIEVDVGDTGATTVELYIGKTECKDGDGSGIVCGAIAPPDIAASPPYTVALRGDVWFRDDLLPYRAEVKGRTATFQVQSDSATTMPILIAVGLAPAGQELRATGTAVLRDVAIPVNSARIVTATLVAAGPVQPGQTDTQDLTEDRVLVWAKDMPPSSCVVVERWKSGQVTRDFVVPSEDPDCDDKIPECNPAAYHGESPPGAAVRPDCFASSGSPACVLASRGCTDDGGPSSGTCTPQHDRVCVPERFCECRDLDGPCTQVMVAASPSSIPRVECTVPAQLVGLAIDRCPTSATTIELGTRLQGLECEQPALASLQLGGLGKAHDFTGALFELSSLASPCSFAITWKTGVRNATDGIDDYGLIKVPLANGALLVPLVLHFEVGACTGQFLCSVRDDNNDALWSCAQ